MLGVMKYITCVQTLLVERFKRGLFKYILKKEYTVFGKSTIILTVTQPENIGFPSSTQD